MSSDVIQQSTPPAISNPISLCDHWMSSINLESIICQTSTPVFVYSENRLVENVRRIKNAIINSKLVNTVAIYVPFFPNSNPHILKALKDEGVGLLLQMPNEFDIITQFGFDDFIISPGHISDQEISFWNDTKYWTFLGSIDEIKFAIDQKAESICLRIDALGSDKPGVKVEQLPQLALLLEESGRDLDCFEVYCGSGNSLADMVRIVKQIFEIHMSHFPTARAINFAGGHGFVYEGWDQEKKHFDWLSYFQEIRDLASEMGVSPDVQFLFEPARDVLADIGILVAGVKRDLISHSVGNIIVTDASRMLMPSAQMRDRLHNVVFFDSALCEIHAGDESSSAMIRGRSILRNDYVLPRHYDVPKSVGAGDYIVIFDVGAYCATQHMEFLNVPPAGEVLIDREGAAHLVTHPGGGADKWRHLLHEPQRMSLVLDKVSAA